MNRPASLLLLALPLSAVLASCSGGGELKAVKSFTFEGGAHQAGRVAYEQRPPAGGAHNGAWQNCGVYDRALYDEYAVHSMEHGAVWITYDPDRVDGDDLAVLVGLVEGQQATMLSPYPDQPTPVSLQAWGHQLALEELDAGALAPGDASARPDKVLYVRTHRGLGSRRDR